MKTSTKFKIWGFSQLAIAILLIVLGSTVFRDKSWDDFAWKPNFALFVPGMFLAVLSLPIILSGFNPQIVKLGAKLQSETIDYAGEDVKEVISKSADTVIPAITPALKQAVSEFKDDNGDKDNDSIEERLIEAKKLFDNHLINEDEYKQMRNNILGINKWSSY